MAKRSGVRRPNGRPSATAGEDNTTKFLVGTSGSANIQLAFGFTPAAPNQVLQYAQFWFGAPSGTTVPSVAVVADNVGAPSSTVVATFSGVSEITGETKYTFSANNAITAGTPYWLVVSNASPSGAFSWFANANGESPTAQNGSGWTYGGVKGSQNSGASWSTYNVASVAAFR